MAELQVGEKVKVMNQKLDGSLFLEGYAELLEIMEDMGNDIYACTVRFEGETQTFVRYINAELQRQVKTPAQ